MVQCFLECQYSPSNQCLQDFLAVQLDQLNLSNLAVLLRLEDPEDLKVLAYLEDPKFLWLLLHPVGHSDLLGQVAPSYLLIQKRQWHQCILFLQLLP